MLISLFAQQNEVLLFRGRNFGGAEDQRDIWLGNAANPLLYRVQLKLSTTSRIDCPPIHPLCCCTGVILCSAPKAPSTTTPRSPVRPLLV
jgi:hypothetical protein